MDFEKKTKSYAGLRWRIRQIGKFLSPSPRCWQGAFWGLAVILSAFYILTAYARVAPPAPSLGSFLAVLKLTGEMFFAGAAILIGLKAMARMPPRYGFVLICGLLFILYLFERSFKAAALWWVVVAAAVPPSILGGCLAALLSPRELRQCRGRRFVAGFGAIASGLIVGWMVFYVFRDGFDQKAPRNAALLSGAPGAHIDLADPSSKGPYGVKWLSYGSGSDRHREEFSSHVELVTPSVNGSAFIDGWDGWSGWARTQYWGFDVEHLPLQGRVWYPDGEGPFPLVLVVHGNHAMEDFSDAGYAYLGELLASRGIIVASVDENFINSSFSGRLDQLKGRGLKKENDARGWLLLEHLRQWRRWNETPGNPFQGKVDMDRVGLIGHSRGGEAVAVAACFNRLHYYPDDATVHFDYGFAIKGVVAIAPVDGQYKPSGIGTPLTDVDYFVLHGSHDGDVQSFAGSRQFERVRFTGEPFHFKSSLYVYGANHGQFNSTWGRADSSFPYKSFLNLAIIMPPEEQAQIAKTTISAFFEVSLRGQRGYLPLFRDFRAGAHWLPDTIYLTHYEDSTHRIISDFDEDLDVTTTTLRGGSERGENLSVWREQRVDLKYGDKATNAAYLGWDRKVGGGAASYTIRLPNEEPAASERSSLVFALADANESPHPAKGGSGDKGGSNVNDSDEDEATEGIDLSVELVDREGVAARLPLHRYALLQPQLKVQVRKADMFSRTATSEPVFQSFFLPLADFTAANSKLDVQRLAAIRFVFDQTERGVVILDDVALREEGEDAVRP